MEGPLYKGKPHKGVGCQCAVIKDYGKKCQAKDVIKENSEWKK